MTGQPEETSPARQRPVLWQQPDFEAREGASGPLPVPQAAPKTPAVPAVPGLPEPQHFPPEAVRLVINIALATMWPVWALLTYLWSMPFLPALPILIVTTVVLHTLKLGIARQQREKKLDPPTEPEMPELR